MKRCLLVIMSLILCLSLLAACGGTKGTATSSKNQGPGLLKFTYGIPTSDYYIQDVARYLGLYQKVGLDPNFLTFVSGAPLLAGLKSGSLDVVTTGNGVMFALGLHVPIKILLWSNSSSAASAFIVNKDSTLTSLRQLPEAHGLIAEATGTCSETDLYFIAKRYGFNVHSLHLTQVPPPDYQSAFQSGAIVGGVAWGPYAELLSQKGYRVLKWAYQYDPNGGACPNLTVVRTAFLSTHPSLGQKLVEVQALAEAEIRRHPELAVTALMKYLNVSESVAKENFDLSWKRFPTLHDQAGTTSPYSLTSSQGTASTLYSVGVALSQTGGIPAPLPLATIEAAIDPSPVVNYVKSGRS